MMHWPLFFSQSYHWSDIILVLPASCQCTKEQKDKGRDIGGKLLIFDGGFDRISMRNAMAACLISLSLAFDLLSRAIVSVMVSEDGKITFPDLLDSYPARAARVG